MSGQFIPELAPDSFIEAFHSMTETSPYRQPTPEPTEGNFSIDAPNMAYSSLSNVESTIDPQMLLMQSHLNASPEVCIPGDLDISSIPQEPFFTTTMNTTMNNESSSFTGIDGEIALPELPDTSRLYFSPEALRLENLQSWDGLETASATTGWNSEFAGQTAHGVEVTEWAQPQFTSVSFTSGSPFSSPHTIGSQSEIHESINQSCSTLGSPFSSPHTTGSQSEFHESINQSFSTTSSTGSPSASDHSVRFSIESPIITEHAESSPVAAYSQASPASKHAENLVNQPTYAQLKARIAELEAREDARTAQMEAEKQAKTAALLRSKRERSTKTSPELRTSPKIPSKVSGKRVSKVVPGRKPSVSPPFRTPGLIEKGWSPGTTREERQALFDEPAPPLHVLPAFQEMMNARNSQAATPSTSKKTRKQSQSKAPHLPGNVVFHGGQAFAPAPDSSSPPSTTPPLTNSSRSSHRSGQIETPTPTPAKGKSKARASSKPGAAPKSSNKVSKSTATAAATKHRAGKSSSSSAIGLRSIQELYNSQFGSLSHEEKCKLVLPLLQGIDPQSSMHTATAAGPLSNDDDEEHNYNGKRGDNDIFAAIGANAFTPAPAPAFALAPAPAPAPASAFAQTPDPNIVVDADSHLKEQLNLYLAMENEQAPWAADTGLTAPLPQAGVASELTLAQQAAADFGPAELGGAMRQQAALRRSGARR